MRESLFLYLITGLLFIILMGGLAGCRSSPGNDAGVTISIQQAPSPSPQAEPFDLANMESMLDMVEHSVLQVSARGVPDDSQAQEMLSRGSGSAWVIDSQGYLITCEHVISGASRVTVTTVEGKRYSAEVVNSDPVSDIAVLKIDARNLPSLKVADTSALKVGDWVVCIGNPLGEGISAKQGIISRKGVDIPSGIERDYQNMIEISSAVNPGTSGGPLVNLSGEVAGIITYKVSEVGIEGMGYAQNMSDGLPVILKLAAR